MNAGDEIGGYALVRRLGSGGAGTVWLAEDGGGSKVALKLVHPALAADEAARRRLEREAATVNSVRSDRVAHVVDIETEASQPFIATEFVEGPTLASLLAQGPLSPQTVAALAMDLARTVEAVHEARIVHRDIKPSNIICSLDGPVLIDFGIAMTDGDEHFTRTGLVSGTAGYTAPELLRAQEADDTSDWWAWTATLLAASTGRPPYGTGDVQGVIMRVLTGEADLAGVDPRVVPVLRLALSPDASARPGVDEIVEELVAAFGLPQGALDSDELDWAALFADEADRARTQVIAPPPSPEPPLARTRAMPTADVTVPLGTRVAPLAPPPVVPSDSYAAAGAPRPQAQYPSAPEGAPVQPDPHPGAPPVGGAPYGGPLSVAVYEESAASPYALDAGYLPDFPRVPWVLGPALLMPLGMLPILMGASGTLLVLGLLLLVAFAGACLRRRERRRCKAGAKRASDTAAMIAASPLMLLRAAAGLALSLALGVLVPYGAWVLNSYASTGDPMWQTIPSLVTSPKAVIGTGIIADPIGAAGAWLVSWGGLLLAWCMPSAVDLRDGAGRFTRAVLRGWWMRALVVLACAGVVFATWILLTGGIAGAAA